MPRLKKLLCCLLMAAMVSLSLPPQAVRAAMVETGQVLDGAVALQAERARLRALLRRAEVQAGMAAQGVGPAEALARVEALSDREVAQIAERLDALSAGGATTTEVLLYDPRLVAYALAAAIALIILTVMLIGTALDAMFGQEDGKDRARATSSGGDSGRGK